MKTKPAPKKPAFPKSPTGIRGLDEITGGGLPTGRPTLLCGGTGCGKTMLAMEFLIRGALEHGEPGVFMAFEETAEELTQNVRSLGFDLADLVARKKLSLDHVHIAQARTRWMRVMKYRGTEHGSNEYPFLIDRAGVSVWPITSLRLEHAASTERVPTGIPQLDTMLGGGGFYRGSSVLLSGTAGTGKSSVAATFADATCRRGERCLYFSFEESPSQILRNMHSIGVDLAPWVKTDRLRIHASRPTYHGLELHLARMVQAITEFAPSAVVVDQTAAESGEAERLFVQEKQRDRVLVADRVTMGRSRHADVPKNHGPQERKPSKGGKA